MKVAILTFHNSPNNAGAVLQAWALQRTIEKLGHQAVVIDYHRARGDMVPWWSFRSPRQIYYTLRRFPWEVLRLRACDCFRRTCLHLVGTQHGGAVAYRDADAFITGSDQVLNPVHNEMNPSFLLDFVPTGKRRIAYGASFGTDAFGAEYCRMLSVSLPKFTALSVRERTAAETARRLAGVGAQVVLDPTLLLDAEEYKPLMSLPHRRVPTEPYVLLYVIGSHPKAWHVAEEKAREIGAKRIVAMTNQRAEWHLPQVGLSRRLNVFTPVDFLAHVAGAAYIVTNSFHGTAFSVIFKRQFTSMSNGTAGDDRMATTLDVVSNGSLGGARIRSIDFLKEALS